MKWLLIALLSISAPVAAQPTEPAVPAEPAAPAADKPAPWYERFSVRGYLQVRFNRLYASNDALTNRLADSANRDDSSFSIRRARFVFAGDVTSFLAMYLQAEFAGAEAKMRDWYGDIFFDEAKTLRLRLGQQKIPYGWENMQSSQNRAPLDRSDGINSGLPGERDLGMILYWNPGRTRSVFKELVQNGLKGSGDYGVVALGVYNGQTLNIDDANENRHVVARVTYPIAIGSQIIEPGLAGYVGKFDVAAEDGSAGDFRDMRAQAQLVWYPQPIGIQAEINIGRGPERIGDAVEVRDLWGGYLMVIANVGDFFPFVRGAYYDGGLKHFTLAPHSVSRELAIGTEWQFKSVLEVTAEVDLAERELDGVEESGAIVRLQAQLNY